jgi:hypothetical protein
VQRRERRRERFRREYRRMMRDASMLYRRHLKRGTLEDRQTAASFLCTAVMWRKLSQGVPPEVHR